MNLLSQLLLFFLKEFCLYWKKKIDFFSVFFFLKPSVNPFFDNDGKWNVNSQERLKHSCQNHRDVHIRQLPKVLQFVRNTPGMAVGGSSIFAFIAIGAQYDLLKQNQSFGDIDIYFDWNVVSLQEASAALTDWRSFKIREFWRFRGFLTS